MKVSDEIEEPPTRPKRQGYGAPPPAPQPGYQATPVPAPPPAPAPAYQATPAPAPPPAPAPTPAPAPPPAPAPTPAPAPPPAPAPATAAPPAQPPPSGYGAGAGTGGAAGGGPAGGGPAGGGPAGAAAGTGGSAAELAAKVPVLEGPRVQGEGIFGGAAPTNEIAANIPIEKREPRCHKIVLDCTTMVGQVQSCFTWQNGRIWMDRKCLEPNKFVMRMTKPPGMYIHTYVYCRTFHKS